MPPRCRCAIRRGDVPVELAGLNFGEVENVVDDGQQGVGAAAGGFDVFALFIGQFGVEQSAVMPMTPFMGVRISWLMLARNSDLARVASSSF